MNIATLEVEYSSFDHFRLSLQFHHMNNKDLDPDLQVIEFNS